MHGSNPYHRECKSNNLNWNRCEEFMEDDAVGVLVLEPDDVDYLLDNGVSIWVVRNAVKVGFLYGCETRWAADDKIIGLTR